MKEQKDRLIWARKQAGYENAKAAVDAFGWTSSTYHAHENGQNGLKKDVAERYARAFGVRVEWLLLGKGEPKGFSPPDATAGLAERIKTASLYADRAEADLLRETGAPTLKNLDAIARLTGVSLEWLATGRGDMTATVLPFASTPATRIRQRRAELGWSREELATFSNVSVEDITALESGHTAHAHCIPQLAQALMISTVWLESGGIGSPQSAINKKGTNFQTTEFTRNSLPHDEVVTEDNTRHSAEVLEIDPRRPKKGTQEGEVEVRDEAWKLPTDFLSENQLEADSSNVVKVIGDGMAPTLLPGQRIFIDNTRTYPDVNGIYAIDRGITIIFARLQLIEGMSPPQVEVMFDNPKYKGYAVPLTRIKIIGMAAKRVRVEDI